MRIAAIVKSAFAILGNQPIPFIVSGQIGRVFSRENPVKQLLMRGNAIGVNLMTGRRQYDGPALSARCPDQREHLCVIRQASRVNVRAMRELCFEVCFSPREPYEWMESARRIRAN